MQLDHRSDHESLFLAEPDLLVRSADPFKDRTPPQDLMAEQSVLGGMLLNAAVIDEVCEIISSSDFYNPRNSIVFDAICALRAENMPVDAVTLVAHLLDAGTLTKVGGGPYIQELLHAVPTAANAGYYARIVADRSQLRRLIETGSRLVQYGYAGGAGGRDVAELVNMAQADLSDAALGRRVGAVEEFTDFLDETIAQILERPSRGLSTGLGVVDDVIGGLKPGQLVLVGARPGVGKTIEVIGMVRAAGLRRAGSVLGFFLEMSKHEIQKRILSAEAGINLARITNGELRPHEVDLLHTAADRVRGCFIHMDDTPQVNIEHIRATARKVQAEKGLDLIVIDYLQLMDTGGDGKNRAVELGAVSRGLKVLARELEIPIVGCVQLNRNSDSRSDRRPQMSDLRESGAFEQDADVIILLHRDDYHDPEHIRAGEVDLIIAKNRNGPIDTVTAAAQLHYARFTDFT
ncbi:MULTISPECIES: replicative DNA helicase [Glycomyces]|uniref:Replicative DNA helicase n=2 Tax=Glycomyces TaxID=58113 RepID=A0ABU2AHV1_9ACTN|nr:replicative DNA helicase [Glycomyces lechevalierae]MDR7336795.1 replicative DNA helicase [Glycomyces lechevalierae]